MGKESMVSVLVLLAFTCFAPVARAANISVNVYLDTTPLQGSFAAPFYLEFQLNDGSGTDDGNNTAVLTNFDLGGGAAGLGLSNIGGSSGSLDTSVTITDSEFFNQFYQEFVPGNYLRFHLELTMLIDAGPQPDRFTMAILDCVFVEIPTFGPGNVLLGIDIDANPQFETYAGDPSGLCACDGLPGIPLSAPIVPEPGTLSMAGLAAVGALLLRKRLR